MAHSANVHIIPANDAIEDAALDVDEGDVVSMKGYLVDIDGRGPGEGKVWWNSSRSRKDVGDGSCEVFWVTELSAL